MSILSHMAVLLAFVGASFAPATLFAQAAKPKLEDELVDDLLKDLPKAKAETPAKGKTTKPATKDEAEKKCGSLYETVDNMAETAWYIKYPGYVAGAL